MMPRHEFPQKVRREALKRSGMKCEGVLPSGERCNASLEKYVEIDHVICDAIGGRPELSNAACLCKLCHKAKTARDAALIAKVRHISDRHLGIAGSRQKIPQRAREKAPPQRRATGKIGKLADMPPSRLARLAASQSEGSRP